MFVTIFLDMEILGEKTLLTRPVQNIVKVLIEIKNEIFFIFTLCGASERFHLFEAPERTERSVRIKN